MTFLRIIALLILFAKPVSYSIRQPSILDCDELVSLGKKQGIGAIEKLINPLSLLYLDTGYAGFLTDMEFRAGLLRDHPDSAGYYILDVPEYSVNIASNIGTKYTASTLFQYYCSVPKTRESDTIILMYQQLYKILPIFVLRKPYKGILERKLIKDFEDWYRISMNSPPVKYADPSIDYDRFTNLKPINKTVDARLITLMLGLALQQLKSPAINESRIRELREMQSTLNNKRFTLPVFGTNNEIFTSPIEVEVVQTTKTYGNIYEFLGNNLEVKLIISSWFKRHNLGEDLSFSQGRYLVKPPDKVYFEIYYEFGMQALRMTLLGNSAIRIEKTMEAID